ncbi:MAG: hypothetical protein HYY07_02370, partial [Elusimicrobia bacterium]|nr:hypothetical protein [Elusimicrobiota bacterium]
WEKGIYLSSLTHDSTGTFAAAMKHVAASLGYFKQVVSAIAVSIPIYLATTYVPRPPSGITVPLKGAWNANLDSPDPNLWPTLAILAVTALILAGIYWMVQRMTFPVTNNPDEETKDFQEQLRAMESQTSSSLYPLLARSTESALSRTAQKSQDRAIPIQVDKILQQKDGETEILHMIQGIVRGIEKQETQGVEGNTVMAIFGERKSMEKLGERIKKFGIPEKYFLKDFEARTTYEAVRKIREKNLAIPFALTAEPDDWSGFYLNLIVLGGEGELRIKGSFALTLWQNVLSENLYDASQVEWNGEEMIFHRKDLPTRSIEDDRRKSTTLQSHA